MKKKIGVLGLGSIGNRHCQNFKELGCEVDGYDPKEGQRTARQDIIEWADAIVIATPTDRHFDDILQVPGKPLFVEKPIVATTLQWATVPTQHIVMVGYNLRFHSCIRKVRDWMGIGAIGKPLWARFTCAQFNDKPDYLRDGVILNWSHEIDLALYLLGPAALVTAAGLGFYNPGMDNAPEDMADIVINHNVTRCQTIIHLDYLTQFERRGFVIVGTNGSIDVDLIKRTAVWLNNKGLAEDRYQGRDTFDGNYLAEACEFLARLDGKNGCGCTAEEAMHVANLALLAKEYIRAR